jgi:hypothetical protein
MDRVVREAMRFPSARRRSRALLAGLSTACVEVLPPELRQGAAEAAPLRGDARFRRLREAVRAFMPEECLAAPFTMAETVASRCPSSKEPRFEIPPLRTLDAASYVFALALQQQLHARGAYGDRAERWVDEFILRSALMGEEEERRAR